jgi:hypothetical protein
MKLNTIQCRSILAQSLLLVALAALAGCASTNYKVVAKTERITSPPAGKALVNFHRVTSWGGAYLFPIFNLEGKYICELPGKAEFQYVCDPGEQVFMAWADQVTVVKADLAPDKIYDVMVDVGMGWMKPNIMLNPLKKSDERRSSLPNFEQRARLISPLRTAEIEEREQKNQQRVADIKRDFLNGAKADRVRHLAQDDCR